MKPLLWTALAFGLLGCAHSQTRKDSTICPEYQDQTCLAGQDCTMDTSRGCRVCQCTNVTDQSFTPTSDPNYIPQH